MDRKSVLHLLHFTGRNLGPAQHPDSRLFRAHSSNHGEYRECWISRRKWNEKGFFLFFSLKKWRKLWSESSRTRASSERSSSTMKVGGTSFPSLGLARFGFADPIRQGRVCWKFSRCDDVIVPLRIGWWLLRNLPKNCCVVVCNLCVYLVLTVGKI